jgi:ubiquinone/menaquinone biosynthesis C-methylase UbiE
LVLAYSVRNRARKAALIQHFMRAYALETVIFVGVAGESPQVNEDVLERAVERAGRVVGAFNVYPAKTPWPFVVADARAMPFRDYAADLVISSAIIEHVGDELDQRLFVAEHRRVGRAWVVTTPLVARMATRSTRVHQALVATGVPRAATRRCPSRRQTVVSDFYSLLVAGNEEPTVDEA